MTDILLCGCAGKMGRAVAACAAKRSDCRIAAGVDIYAQEVPAFPLFGALREFPGKAEVIIDFSNPAALADLLAYAVETKTPAVICTTGHSAEQKAEIEAAAQKVPLFFSANMSLGVSLTAELAKLAARVLGGYDIEIIEMHHNQKVDAPSGTAIMLADAIASELAEAPEYTYDRHAVREKRGKNEIGIHAVRGGTITGEHEILFAGHDEIIKISHSARSKELFAVGAVKAALFLQTQSKAGLYQMADLVKA